MQEALNDVLRAVPQVLLGVALLTHSKQHRHGVTYHPLSRFLTLKLGVVGDGDFRRDAYPRLS